METVKLNVVDSIKSLGTDQQLICKQHGIYIIRPSPKVCTYAKLDRYFSV